MPPRNNRGKRAATHHDLQNSTAHNPDPQPEPLLNDAFSVLSISPPPPDILSSQSAFAPAPPHKTSKLKLKFTAKGKAKAQAPPPPPPPPLTPNKKHQDHPENPEKICISTLLTADDLLAMPSLDPSLLRSNRRTFKSLTHAHSPLSSMHTTSSISPHKTLSELEKEKSLERNIDNVLFGDILFKSWYPSWYPKEVLGEKALNEEGKGIVVDRLFVCNRCFAYTKVLGDFVRHGRKCERWVPGNRIYVHAEGDGPQGVWSAWEVDGDVDTIFCQNLSLFAKLFLDNKSVFFDVSSFLYFLLVHTHPTTGAQQIVGFFSKEKMSWDSNNLACILIFPPWQRKGLGTILMGVSYEISRREEILGGPEKPISDLGKKGYKRFWGGEIARWLLEHRDTDKKKNRGWVTVEECSRETWIALEDCLSVLRDMGVVERTGRGKGEVERVKVDKERVREWARKEGLSLQRTVDPEGFMEGYGYKVPEEEDEIVDEMDIDGAEVEEMEEDAAD